MCDKYGIPEWVAPSIALFLQYPNLVKQYVNPKMAGSNVIEAIPQRGPCPVGCKHCYYNERFYAPIDLPLLPSLEDAEGKIVRVNSGNDSNNHRNYVIEATRPYKHKFYNTSLPTFDVFPGPVMYTCNPGMMTDLCAYYADDVNKLMAVRIRVNTWNLAVVDRAIDYYTHRDVPVVLTFMRYPGSPDEVPLDVKRPLDYEVRKHVVHAYWDIKHTYWKDIVHQRIMQSTLVYTCGTPTHSLCKDCNNCQWLYWRWVEKNQEQMKTWERAL